MLPIIKDTKLKATRSEKEQVSFVNVSPLRASDIFDTVF